MFSSLQKGCLSALLTILSLSTLNSSLTASECCEVASCNRLYLGAFGGGLYSDTTSAYQMGTIFFVEAQGGPLAIVAKGKTNKTTSGFGGVQLGYELAQCPLNIGCSGWSLAPAFEVEAYWYSRTTKGLLLKTTPGVGELAFDDSFHTKAGVYLANFSLSLNNSFFGSLSPYVSGGIGATRLSIENAKSFQQIPVEAGINHFNTKPSDSSWAFAAQVKTGLSYKICESFHIFAEYRYLFVDSSNYLFGSTYYEDHAATSPWNVQLKNTHYNAFAIGIQYDL